MARQPTIESEQHLNVGFILAFCDRKKRTFHFVSIGSFFVNENHAIVAWLKRGYIGEREMLKQKWQHSQSKLGKFAFPSGDEGNVRKANLVSLPTANVRDTRSGG